ncbi:hypothetical protein JCM14467A_25140 [Vulcanisaeta sp. JCM 14467]
MGSKSRLLFITVLVVTVVVAAVILVMPRPLTNHSAVVRPGSAVTGGFSTASQGVVGSPISIDVPIYVVGPSMLVQRLVSVGVNESLIKPVTVGELPSLPGNSLVVIDWSVIGPNLIINRSGLMRVNVNSTSFRLIRELIRRGDFLIIHGNASEAPAIELALATAWARAFNTSIMAIPVPRYLSGLDYVIAYGNNHVLVIGPHSLNDALNIASKYWTPIIMKISTPDPTGEDVCLELATNYSIPYQQPTQVNNAYIIVYGPQHYSDSLGTFTVDFCTSWSENINPNINGYSAGSAQLFNFIDYTPEPNSGTQIEYLETFQDALASYMVYEYETGQTSQLPGDVQYIAGSGGGYEPGYWTDLGGYGPLNNVCTVSQSYQVGIAISYEGVTPSTSVGTTYSCPQYTDTVTGASTGAPLDTVINRTWVFEPTTSQAASAEATFGTMSWGVTYMGSAYNPQPSAYTIPAGSLVAVESDCPEYIVYDINWDVWVNSNGAMNPYSFGAYIVPPGTSGWSWSSSNGFYYYEHCPYIPILG